MGTTWADFHSLGSLPKERDMLKSLVTAHDILVAVCFSILADTRSGPVALARSREDKRRYTPSTVHKSCGVILLSARM